MKTARRSLISLALLAAVFTFPACGDKENQDTLYSVAKALHRVANATARADEVTYRLYKDKLISAQDAEIVSNILEDVRKASVDFQTKARTYTVFNEQAKADILKYAGDTRDFIANRIADGALRIKNERARGEWQAIVNAAHDSFVSIVRLVQAAKPEVANG